MPRAKMEKLTPDSSMNVISGQEVSEHTDNKTDLTDDTNISNITNELDPIIAEEVPEEMEDNDPERFLVKVSSNKSDVEAFDSVQRPQQRKKRKKILI
jgi:hypothetical protein